MHGRKTGEKMSFRVLVRKQTNQSETGNLWLAEAVVAVAFDTSFIKTKEATASNIM